MLLSYRVKVSDTKVTHFTNISNLHMFISITFTATSIDETNKTQQKIRGSKFMFKMSTIHANTCIQTTTPLRNRCRDDAVVQQPSLPQQTFFQLFHIMDMRTVDPLLKDTPDAVVHWIQIWRIGWSHRWRDKLLASLYAALWQCHVHGERLDFGDVSITSPEGISLARNVVNLPVWLVFICKVVYQKS